MYLTSLSMNLFYKYLKTKILSFFFLSKSALLITCHRDIKVHRASWIKWQSCDLYGSVSLKSRRDTGQLDIDFRILSCSKRIPKRYCKLHHGLFILKPFKSIVR